MKLSDGEKLIVALLCDIHKVTVRKGGGEIDVDLVMASLYGGHLWGLKWEMPGVFENEEPSEEEVHEVCDILNMWSNIENSYSLLNDEQKHSVAEGASPFGGDVKFRGFDGNRETSYMSIARFLVEKLHRFEEFCDHELNSHAPSLEAYRRMIVEYGKINESGSTSPLNEEQIIRLLREMIHPNNR